MEVVSYDPKNGIFTWIATNSNRAKAGSICGTVSSVDGYARVMIDGKRYLLHRLAWLYMTGNWPKNQIDHVDTRRDNNAWANLREATPSQNQWNTGAQRNNKLGLKGVSIHRDGGFQARINVNGKSIYLGYFPTPEKAYEAYTKAANDYFGEFSRVS